MAKTEITKKTSENVFIKVLLVLICFALSFIAYSFINTNKNLSEINNKLTEVENITRSTGIQVDLIKDSTGQQALSNPRKETLDKCIQATNTLKVSTQDATALLIYCIGNYLAD